MKQIKVFHGQNRKLLVRDGRQTESPFEAMVGLLNRSELGEEEGLLLKTSGSIHTFFMRFAIDVVFLDGDFRVKRIYHSLKPFRFTWSHWGTRWVLELPAGRCERVGLSLKEVLTICPLK